MLLFRIIEHDNLNKYIKQVIYFKLKIELKTYTPT